MAFHRVPALAAAFLLACAPTGVLANPPSAVAVQQDPAELMADWLSRMAAWGQGYERVLLSRSDTLVWLVDLSAELSARIERGETRDLDRFTAGRAAEARARLQADVSAYEALSTTQPPLDPSFPVSPTLREQIRRTALMPDLVGSMLISTGQSSESYLTLYEAAGSGEPEDLIRLAAGLLNMNSAQLEAENTMLAGNLGNPESPSHHLTRASIETNKAMILWLEHRRAIVFEEPADRTGKAAGVRRHAAMVRDAATQADLMTERLARIVRSDPQVSATGLGEMVAGVAASFHEAAGIERGIAVELEAIAIGLEKGDMDAEDEAADRLSTLVVQRLESDSARRQLMAQMGA
ncbi:hypothetical protein [Brevundimonas sp.]|uniref:hypothetical protein n=1 Tax=Brevundimonas sp. TaxID=1871086 RepID=UPI002ED8C7B8